MASKNLLELLTDDGPEIWYRESFRNVIESHLEWLKRNNRSYPFVVQPNLAYKYENDFYGLLAEFKVPRYWHWIVLRLNNYTSPFEYQATTTALLMPDPTILEGLKDNHSTVQKIT